jgi:hypothetical protein
MGHHGMEKMKKSNWMWQESEYRGSKKKLRFQEMRRRIKKAAEPKKIYGREKGLAIKL